MGHPQVRRCFFFAADDEDQKLKLTGMITFWQTIVFIIIAYVLCVVIHLVKVILFKDRLGESLWPTNRQKPVKILIVMGSGPFVQLVIELVVTADFSLTLSIHTGGHTGEMVRLLAPLDFRHFSPRLYLVARTDDMSAQRVQQLESSHVSTADSVNILYSHKKNLLFSS